MTLKKGNLQNRGPRKDSKMKLLQKIKNLKQVQKKEKLSLQSLEH